jgi:cytochrome c-type biogenesis protein CcmH/NrfF
MAVAGAAIALVGIAVLLWPPSSTTSIVLVSLAPVPIVLLGVAPIVRFARRLR